MLTMLALALVAQAPTVTPSPSPTPSATPTPPAVTVGADFTLYNFGSFTEISNGLLNVNASAGRFHAAVTVGDYAFPVVGFPLAADTAPGANEQLYGPLPLASVTYNFDSHTSIAAGKFAALLGQESPLTFQDLNIQRGLGWNMEPTISRGVQLAYTKGPWSATLQENDAYYSGSNRAFEALIGWAPSANTNLQFAAIVPGANVPGNATTGIGNKSEYDLMYTRTIGKLQLLPYYLIVRSPASAQLGYTNAESATAAVLLADWTSSPVFSIIYRFESVRNSSAANDHSPNADLVGFGPGSSAQSHTITSAYRFGNGGILRLEYSRVNATGSNQNRFGIEIGVMH